MKSQKTIRLHKWARRHCFNGAKTTSPDISVSGISGVRWKKRGLPNIASESLSQKIPWVLQDMEMVNTHPRTWLVRFFQPRLRNWYPRCDFLVTWSTRTPVTPAIRGKPIMSLVKSIHTGFVNLMNALFLLDVEYEWRRLLWGIKPEVWWKMSSLLALSLILVSAAMVFYMYLRFD